MSNARNKVTLTHLSELSRLMPQDLPRDRVLEALGYLSLECSSGLGKLSFRDGWIAEYHHLSTAVQLTPTNDLLLFITSGGVKVDSANNSPEYVKSGDQVLVKAGARTHVIPVSDYGEVSFIALSVELDLAQIMESMADVRPVQPPYYWGYDKRYAQTYAEGGTTWETQEPNDIVVMMVPELIIDKAHEKILDLGCGEGRDTIWLASQGFNVTGVDVSAAALDRAREIAAQHKLSPNFLERDVVFLRGLRDESFSVALNMGCLHMMDSSDHRAKHLARTFALLRPGGTFILNHCKKDWGKGFWSLDDYQTIENAQFGDVIPRKIRLSDGTTKEVMMEVLHNKVMSGDALRDELRNAGFVDIEVLEEDKFTFGNSAIAICRRPS
ncbi:bifunctional 2-polyprenyl-6-hydroxyphenol methylase/3-demethylubiquinol 3-O-methyltransferase UbiG [Pseudomonas sp. B21-048]|uniref:class I SAM-dependent methyltransferase n=1 Tax=Pseudomonas sp. B21-048 TaxID=2895490 RepID=UPI00215E0079|nr:class I SAM-dependent methyltransferase [Pseudomonas sp. B21-048]UVL00423.1 class I SAM-dependent methyltransferase [Pseudomonas sp. B21-048]